MRNADEDNLSDAAVNYRIVITNKGTVIMFNPLLHVVVVIAAIGQASSAPLGLKFEKRSGSLPTLTLPYSTYQATSYDSTTDVRVPFIYYT